MLPDANPGWLRIVWYGRCLGPLGGINGVDWCAHSNTTRLRHFPLPDKYPYVAAAGAACAQKHGVQFHEKPSDGLTYIDKSDVDVDAGVGADVGVGAAGAGAAGLGAAAGAREARRRR
jgi:hypothetical protein